MNWKPYIDFVVWCCLCTSTLAFDEFMYCARVTRTQRAMIEKIPCDLTKDTYCTEPGDLYPWRSIRQYMRENQGTMKRMYGEARQLNIFKNEFMDTVDYSNGFLENTFFYDDDALHQYRKRPTYKPPVTEELTSAMPITEGTTKSSTTEITSSTVTTTMGTEAVPTSENVSEVEDLITVDDLPTAEALIGELNETSIDALDLSVATAFEQALELDDQVTYVELTPTDEAALRLEDEILATLTTDAEVPSKDFTVSANVTESPLNRTTVTSTTGQTESTSTTTAATSVVTTTTSGTTTTTATSTPTTTTTKTTETTTTTTTSATTSTTKVPKKSTKPSTIRTKKPQPPVEGDLRTPFQKQGTPPSLPVPAAAKEQPAPYFPAYGANACETKEEVFAPFWVNSTKGKVYAAMNIYPYEQFIHYEKCTNEHQQMFCREGCRCEQQYSLHRLLVFDVLNECRGIFSDWFRMPSSCVCKCYFHPGDPRSTSSRRPRIYEETREQRLRRKAAEAYSTVRKYTEEAEQSGKFDETDYDPDLESDIFHSKISLLDEVDRKPVHVDPLVLDGARSARKMSLGEKIQVSSTESEMVTDGASSVSEGTSGATSTPEQSSSTTSTTTSTTEDTAQTAKAHRFAVKTQKEIQPSLSVKKQLKTETFDMPINFAEEKIPRRPILQIAKDNKKIKFKTARNYQINLDGGSEDGVYAVQWAKPVSEGAQVLKNPR